MRTTLNIEDEAIAEAMNVAPGKSKTQVINEALREFARRRKLRGLLKFQGRMRWQGNIDELRNRGTSKR